MTRRRGRRLALAVLLAIMPSPALAQTPPLPSPLTLERAVDRLLARNLAVEAARYRVDGARAERLAAGLRPNPTLTLEAEDVKLSGPTPAGDLYQVTSSVSYPIELGDKRRLRVEAADVSIAVAEARLADVLQQRLADLKRAFYDVLLARAAREHARETRQTFDALVEFNQARLEEGAVAEGELLKVRLERGKHDTALTHADLAVRQAGIKLLDLLGESEFNRENVQRRIIVQANVAGRDLGSVIAEVRQAIDGRVALPQGYFVQYGGQFESQERAARQIALLSAAAIGGIFLLLYLALRSGRLAALVMANLPLPLIGGVVMVFGGGGTLSIASLIGFITLFGIATRNGIMLITHYRHLTEEESVGFRDAIVQGSMERLSPILMTALVTGIGLVPLALGAGEPGKEIQQPMAVVILGGIATSTALNMIVLPALYLKYGRAPARRAREEPAMGAPALSE